jgi:hypothetical protein
MRAVFTIYLLVAGMADNILKHRFHGRGVYVPVPFILPADRGSIPTALGVESLP